MNIGGIRPRGYLAALGIALLNIVISTLFPLTIVPLATFLVEATGRTPPAFLSDPVIGFFLAALVFTTLLTFESIVFLSNRLSGTEENISDLVQKRIDEGFRTSATVRLMAQIARAREIDTTESQLIDGAVSTFLSHIERLSPPLSLASLWMLHGRIGSFLEDVTALQRGEPIAMSLQEQIDLSAFLASISSHFLMVETFVHEQGPAQWTTGFRKLCEKLSQRRDLNKVYCFFMTCEELRARAEGARSIITFMSGCGFDVRICEPEKLMDAFSLSKTPATGFEYFEGARGRLIEHYEADREGYKGGKTLDVSVIERTKGGPWDKCIKAIYDFSDPALKILDGAVPTAQTSG